ncbi:hypothetical protein Syun_011970 [Stephania yunnanensis]|uniref:Uncharacterized protein n=1 Tax=Stephania yunnanensis TaxID=152371 RepID=A0AAP0PIK9_9MAGN
MDNHGGDDGLQQRRVREGGFKPIEVDSLDEWWRYSQRACSRRKSSWTAATARLWFLAEFTREERRERREKKGEIEDLYLESQNLGVETPFKALIGCDHRVIFLSIKA